MNEQQLAYCAAVLHSTLVRPTAKEMVLLLLAERPLTRNDITTLVGRSTNMYLPTLIREGLIDRRGYRLWKRCVFYILTDEGRAEVQRIVEPLKRYCVPDSEEFTLDEANHVLESTLSRSSDFTNLSRLRVRYGDEFLITAYPQRTRFLASIRGNARSPLISENERVAEDTPKIFRPMIRKKSKRSPRRPAIPPSKPKRTRKDLRKSRK